MDHILLIKSRAAATEALADRLRVFGYEVSVAADARDAYGIYIQDEPQLVLVHHVPNDEDRLDVIKTFRARGRRSPLPIATLLDGETDAEDHADCMRAGADLVLAGAGDDHDRVVGAVSKLLDEQLGTGSKRTVQAEIGKALVRVTSEVFETMLDMDVSSSDFVVDRALPRRADVVASIGVAGCLAGSLSMFLNRDFADRIAAKMLNIDGPCLLGNAVVCDAIGEVVNMISGCLKAELFDQNPLFEVSVPGVYLGRDLMRGSSGKDTCVFAPFEHAGSSFAVEFLMVHTPAQTDMKIEGQIAMCPLAV